MAEQHRLDDRVTVDAHDERLADIHVLGDAFLGVEAQRNDSRAGDADESEVRALLDGRREAEGDERRDIDAAGLELGHLGVRLRDEAGHDLVDLRRAAPMIRKGFQRQAHLRRVLDELERSGADRIHVEVGVALLLDVFRRHDHAAIAGKLRQQHRIGLLHDEVDRVVVDDLHLGRSSCSSTAAAPSCLRRRAGGRR